MSPSLTGLASPPTPRTMASAAPKGQPFPFPFEATAAPQRGNLPAPSTGPDLAGFIEAQKAMLEAFKGDKPKASEEEKPKVKEAESIKLPLFPKAGNLQVMENRHEGSNQSCKRPTR